MDEAVLRQQDVVITQEAVADVHRLLKINRRITTLEIAEEISMSIGSVYAILRERLQYRKICAQWVSKHLTEEQ